jgi:hypothetical protein
VRVIEIPFGMLIGFLLWFFLRYGFGGFYTVGPSERAVLTSFGRVARIPGQMTLNDLNETMNVECAADGGALRDHVRRGARQGDRPTRRGGPDALRAYLRNAGLGLLRKARQLVLTRDMKEAP